MRQEIGGLGSNAQQWDPVMLWYARGIRTMQNRPASDPTSWEYQAGIHGFSGQPRPLFNQCEHSTWYFLPWHRMYLWQFEQIVRAAVIAAGGPRDWALPFWDYSLNPVLPWVFRQPTMPTDDGGSEPNPLFIAERNPNVNAGAPLNAFAIDSSSALLTERFGPTPGSFAPTFGGSQTTPQHFGGGPGDLELTPHNSVHVEVGRPNGFMLDPNRAALDPIFWTHHANIDRLWALWNRQGNVTTDEPSWNNQTFDLFDVNGAQVTMSCGQVADIEAQLGYTYAGLPAQTPPAFDTGFDGAPPMPSELIGGTDESVALSSDLVHTSFDLESTASFDQGSDDGPRRYILQLDAVTGDAPPATSYKVMLDLGTPEDPSDDFYVGLASFFGVEQASSVDGGNVPHGMSATYDITRVVERLQAQGLWDGSRAAVSFVPLDDDVAAGASTITVGSVKIFVE